MKVSADKYELPLAVESSVEALARRCGVTRHNIYRQMFMARHGYIKKTQYRVVEIEEE
jgi:hypothetical protein